MALLGVALAVIAIAGVTAEEPEPRRGLGASALAAADGPSHVDGARRIVERAGR